jgi:hypothetical protein
MLKRGSLPFLCKKCCKNQGKLADCYVFLTYSNSSMSEEVEKG